MCSTSRRIEALKKGSATPEPSSIIPEDARQRRTAAAGRESVLGVIPARLASTRLPRKVLREIAGRPLLAWVHDAANAARQAGELDDVVVATDSPEVEELCRREGWRCERTSPDLQSGTDRLEAVAVRIPAKIYVNIQGDEPLLELDHIRALLRPFAKPGVEVTTLKVLCTEGNERNPHAVKVVTALDGRALYFSRATIPYNRDETAPAVYWKHIGLYAYRRAALARFAHLQPSVLEQTERLEQLRFLENGMSLYVEPTEIDTVGVDTHEDLHAVEAILLSRFPLSRR